MKLWKKLSLMTVIVLLLTTGPSGAAVIWHAAYYNVEKTRENYEQQLHFTALSLGTELSRNNMASYSAITQNSYLNYLMQKHGADHYILLWENRIACNLTPYNLNLAEYDRQANDKEQSIIQKTGDRYILIADKTISGGSMGTCRLILIQDISDVYADIRQQALLAGILYLGGAVLAVILIFLLTRKILSPLQSLQQAAEDIGCGRLSKRVDIRTNDEVGIVANAFNVMADQIEEQLTALSELSEQRRQMLGSLAHEMKTPMTSIIGYTDTLLHVRVKEAQQKRALAHIHQESRRLERISGKMMSLIGLYDNESICLEQTSIADLFARVCELERLPLSQKNIHLQTYCEMEDKMLDSDLFESLLINLIDNSAKASSPGSTIFLTGTENKISVTDQGCGIPEKELKQVTQAFYRIDKARSRKEGGCGLGLSLCVEIARLHQAELVIESEEGRGTTVSVLWSGT